MHPTLLLVPVREFIVYNQTLRNAAYDKCTVRSHRNEKLGTILLSVFVARNFYEKKLLFASHWRFANRSIAKILSVPRDKIYGCCKYG